MKRWAN
jgi:hormone-sensitive lipase